MTLTQKYEKLTGIHFKAENAIEDYVDSFADDEKVKAYNNLQWKIAKGKMRDPELIAKIGNESVTDIASKERAILYAEVMTELAELCGVTSSSIDINGNNIVDPEDEKAMNILSEAEVILGYDDEDDEDDSSN